LVLMPNKGDVEGISHISLQKILKDHG